MGQTQFKTVAMLAAALVGGRAAQGQRSLAEALSMQAAASNARVAPVDTGEPVPPPASTEAALESMAAQAAVVFTGEVLSVERGEGAVTVKLRVEEAVRGVAAGSVYTLREWAGLWAGGEARYTVGQRSLMLLHAPSAAGFTSPVGGDGAIPVSGSAAHGTVDLRWVATHALRSGPAAKRGSSMLQAAGAAVDATQPVDTDAEADRGVVMDLLRAWTRAGAAQ